MEKSITAVVANMIVGAMSNISTKESKKTKTNQSDRSVIDRKYDRSEIVKRGGDFHFFV